MDKDPIELPQMQNQSLESADGKNESQIGSHSPDDQNKAVMPMRRQPRSTIKGRGKIHHQQKNGDQENQNDEDFETQKPKLKEKNHSQKEERENSLDGFLKIIDYLKKIQCDQASLHNKMNPFNLLTPTCFWYMISAEYFSFDFFSGRNIHELALQLLRKAQKTQITLPLRLLKVQKIPEQLDFQTPELRQLSAPITQKLINLIPSPSNSPPQTLERSTFVTSVLEDDQFRSSVRSIAFNFLKKKINNSDKWGSTLRPRLESAGNLPQKSFTTRVLECRQEIKHQQLQVAPQVYYRQRKVQKSNLQTKDNKDNKDNKDSKDGHKESKPKTQPKKAKNKKNPKKPVQDQIYDQSESVEPAPEQMLDQSKQKQLCKNQQKQEFQQNDQQIENGNEQTKKQTSQQQIFNQEQQNEHQDSQIKMEEEKNDSQLKMEEQALKSQQHQNGKIKQSLNSFESLNHSAEENQKNAEHTNNQITIVKNYNEDDLLLDSLLHLPLDSVISILKSAIEPVRLPELVRPFMPPGRGGDPLELVYQTHPDEEVFLEYMKDRQEKMFNKKTVSESLIEQKQRQGQAEDAKCQVCTDGDYTDDNLIVFCSMCNISLHQRCVGLAKVPADNWICEVCASFGPAGINLPCPLCNVKGGAMKRTNIHISSPLFKDTNPEYNEYAKKCPNYKHKQEYTAPLSEAREDQPYYDYFSKATYPQEQPTCHFVWVHYVCAIWIPQCYFQQKNGIINIKGIENIDKKRFKQKCLICQKSKAGACIKCQSQNCWKFYHPQCARKRKVYMEQLNLDKLKYLIFCEAHEPLKVKRKIQVKKKKQRDQIVKFCRGIEKYVQTYKIAYLPFKLAKLGTPQGQQQKPDKSRLTQGQMKVSVKVDKNTDEDFIRSVIEGLIKQNQIVVVLGVMGNGRYKVQEVVKPSKRDMRKSLTRLDQFWKNFKNSETPENNLKRFNQINRQNIYLRQKIDSFINSGLNPDDKQSYEDRKGRGNNRRRREKIETVIEQQGAIFCVCRKPYEGENDMFECQVCNQWYHHNCIGFVGSEEDAQTLDFHCMKCLKYETPENKKALLDKCARFFSEDSLFLNYRPPTPSLQSEQQDNDRVIQLQKPQPQVKQQPVVQKTDSRILKRNILGIDHRKREQIPDIKINLQKPFIVFQARKSALQRQNQSLGGAQDQKISEMKDEKEQQNNQKQNKSLNAQNVNQNQVVPPPQQERTQIQVNKEIPLKNLEGVNQNGPAQIEIRTENEGNMDVEQPIQLPENHNESLNGLNFNQNQVKQCKEISQNENQQQPKQMNEQ